MITPRTPSTALLAAGLLVLTALPAAAQPHGGPAIPRFVEETKASKLRHVYSGDSQYFVGGGVATFDCDDDGVPELFLAGGSKPATLWRNRSTVGGSLRFARKKSPVTDLESVTGAYPLDIDSDGITDLALLRVGETVLLRGLGGCAFERANETWAFDGDAGWTTAFAATWEGDAALPALALGTYVDTATSDERIGNCGDNRIHRPNAAGTGYDAPLVLTPGFCALSMLISDWGRTGQRDLRISNDRHYAPDGEEQLWRMTPGEVPTLYTEADGWQKLVIWGMGIASADLTGDGKPEVYLTSMGDNRLQTLVPGATGPHYDDISFELGATLAQPSTGGQSKASTSWHAQFEDVNNDGLMDLFVTKGNVEAMETYASKDPNELLLGGTDGSFTIVTKASGLTDFERTRGAAVVDLNLDGLLDVVTVERRENVRLWRNVGAGTPKVPAPMDAFIALQLRQPAPNPAGIGSWVEVRTADRTQAREITVGGGHVSGQLGWLHVGLGAATSVEVRVQWPDGEVGPWQPVNANSWAIIERGASAPEPWVPPGG